MAQLQKLSLCLFVLDFSNLNRLLEGQQLKHPMTWVCVVSQDAACPLETVGVVKVLRGGERLADDLLGGFSDPLSSYFLCAVVQLETHTEIQYVSTLSMEPEAGHPLYALSIYADGLQISLTPPEAHSHLFYLGSAEDQVVLCTPVDRPLDP